MWTVANTHPGTDLSKVENVFKYMLRHFEFKHNAQLLKTKPSLKHAGPNRMFVHYQTKTSYVCV